jgi:hypothetical protein
MADQTGILIIKRFVYRGVNEEWTNKYWLTGDIISSQTEFEDAFYGLANAEKAVYTNRVTIIGGYGYDDSTTNAPSKYAIDLEQGGNSTIPGTLPTTGGEQNPGDTAVMCWWKTTRRTNPGGKPIYLRKYFHDTINATGSGSDAVETAQAAALQSFADALSNPTALGRAIAAQGHPNETLLAYGHHPWVTTRTLKRRGKRPLAQSASSS